MAANQKSRLMLLEEVEKNSAVKVYLQNLQNKICHALENEDGKAQFEETLWEKLNGGGGYMRLLTEGDVIEQGGV